MPILAGIPVVTVPPGSGPVWPDEDDIRDSRTLAFRGLDGTEPFSDDPDRQFIARDGIQGLDFAPREVVRSSLPRVAGSKIREIRTSERVVDFPIFIRSDSHTDYLAMRAELIRLFSYRRNDYRTDDGTCELVARSVLGERYLRCALLDGMAGGMFPLEGALWGSFGPSLLACQPYWIGQPWSTPEIRRPIDAAWFGTFPGGLTSSRALGADITVTVPGDVESWVTVDLVGPATSVAVTSDGLSISIPGGLAAGETARLITNPRNRSVSFNGQGGAAAWSRIAPSDRYAPLDPGDHKMTIVVTGAGGNTTAVVRGDSLWETPW